MMEIEAEQKWRELAEQHWLKSTSKTTKVRTDIFEQDIWEVLKKDNFNYRSLMLLENLQLLEKYLCPGYSDNSSNHQVLLIALLMIVKSREGLPVWDVFSNNTDGFSSFFRRILSMSVDTSLTLQIRTHILAFLINAFQSLDNSAVRKECAPLVSIAIWCNLTDDAARELKFEQHPQLRKAWRAALKRYTTGDTAAQAKLQFERSWLNSLILTFVNYLSIREDINPGVTAYCERFMELLIDLLSQLPTRRYVNTLIQDLNLMPLIKLSPALKNDTAGVMLDLLTLFGHFMRFPINDYSGLQYSLDEMYEHHCRSLAKLQRTAFKHFKSKLTLLALSNFSTIDQRSELESYFLLLSDLELAQLCRMLGLRTQYPLLAKVAVTRELLTEILVSAHERRQNFREVIRDIPILPTEADLYEPSLLRNETYNGSQSLAIPKLNLQYLSVGDFLFRSFVLHRCESFFEIRKDLEDAVRPLQPRRVGDHGGTHFDGYSRMSLPISKLSILEVSPPKIGFSQPAYVRAEVALDVSKLSDRVQLEWDALRPDDVVYLLAVSPREEDIAFRNGGSSSDQSCKSGLLYIRAAQVVQIFDESGRAMKETLVNGVNGHTQRGRARRLLVDMDALAFQFDEANKSKGKPNVHEKLNLIVRRKGRENNFKRVLESIRSLILSDVPLPSWIQEVFLGYGDPTSANYAQMSNRLERIDFRDTFLDWNHLVESFRGKTLIPDADPRSNIGPPYILSTPTSASVVDNETSTKGRRGDKEQTQLSTGVIKVSAYQLSNNGPYVADNAQLNDIRFTAAQIDAIVSGTQPGLTLIVGPPGTGKTDVATQIINNLYHNFPMQRTLIVAHSNQALNQIFQKITKLDIDGRHLLRLGHGEEELETNSNYGKRGRVESFLDNRTQYLAEVERLAANLKAPGAHANSSETAGYFKSVYVDPAWAKFWEDIKHPGTNIETLRSSFPFYAYFHNAPQPLFPADCSKEELVEIARGCQRHIDKIFSELEGIRPFEVLRSAKERSNYLLIKEARVIAMTSTHAAMQRQQIADLGFHYDNIIVEEAAQITEIGTFIPLILQHPKDGKLPLQRIVLCGDHLQNSPIIQNSAFRQFANLEQSLFLRLVRLNVPVINLDRQGRARPSITELYRWRYQNLGDLPSVLDGEEFKRANAGFLYDYQFIDVPNYKGVGEVQPTPHFTQNLGEAEYAVAIYQYMRLLGYPATQISILATYAGQKSLIHDVLHHRCARNKLFGLPRIVTTVDKYQGEQNNYIILSLTRTKKVGYLRDIRRLTVALSRARLGLYILGRREVFESCYELTEAFDRLLSRPDRLMLVPGEVFPTSRDLHVAAEPTEMTGVEHLGQYVCNMTQSKSKDYKDALATGI